MFVHFHAGRSPAFLGALFGREYIPKQGRAPGCYSKLHACPLHCYWSSCCFYHFSSSVYVLDYLFLDPNTRQSNLKEGRFLFLMILDVAVHCVEKTWWRHSYWDGRTAGRALRSDKQTHVTVSKNTSSVIYFTQLAPIFLTLHLPNNLLKV